MFIIVRSLPIFEATIEVVYLFVESFWTAKVLVVDMHLISSEFVV